MNQKILRLHCVDIVLICSFHNMGLETAKLARAELFSSDEVSCACDESSSASSYFDGQLSCQR
ncbi:MAG: hypothetical protein AAF483_25420 [Planctomycetota bacterium]